MIITTKIMSESQDLTPWLASRTHSSEIYAHPNVFAPELLRVVHDGLCNDECEVLFKEKKYTETLYDEI